jgi:opacity protein-like surface antigen
MRLKEQVLAAALLLALVSTHAATPAEAGLRLVGVDGITSTVLQQDQSSFSGIALRVRLHPESAVPALTVMPTIEYWRSRNKVNAYAIRSSRTDATLGADLRWDFRSSGVRPYLGGGYAVHFLSSEVTSAELGLDESDSTIKGGLAALGGLSFALSGSLDNFVEVKYHHIPGYRQVKLNWGLAWSF